MQKITPFLWFNNNAEEAVNFYTSIFKDSGINSVTRYDAASSKSAGMAEGTVLTVSFELNSQEFLALNGGPHFKFNEAVSFVINCNDQAEVDYYWEQLTSDGGQESMCGWLKDKYGLSWQIVPTIMTDMVSDPDSRKSERAMKAMLQMKKMDIEALTQAFTGKN